MQPSNESVSEASLQPTWFIDSDHPLVVAFTKQTLGGISDPHEAARALFYAVRDSIRYNPYNAGRTPEEYKASSVLTRKQDFCVPKAILLTACARAARIPARLGFADVKNHLATPRLIALMRTDVFAFHGFSVLFLAGRWVKVAPTFNRTLCEKMGVGVLEFDGYRDAMLHPFDLEGKKHMEYLHHYGEFDDFPMQQMLLAWKQHYPHFIQDGEPLIPTDGSLEADLKQD